MIDLIKAEMTDDTCLYLFDKKNKRQNESKKWEKKIIKQTSNFSISYPF